MLAESLLEKGPFLKIPGAPARRGNASRELVKKGPVFENSWRPCEARQGLAESLSFPPPGLPPYSGSRIPSVFRLPDFVAAGAKNPGLPEWGNPL